MARFRMLNTNASRNYAVVLDSGDSAMEELLAFARESRLQAASFTAIGGFSECTLAFFDVESRQYLDIPVEEQAEVLSLIGDIVRTEDDDWQVHAHAVLGLRDGSTRGGHLKRALVRPKLEVVLTELPSGLSRRYDTGTGLALIDLDEESLGEESPARDRDPLRHGLAPPTDR
ncbi:PPC domain-containing DNA-binding protein [Saccharothrix isguenensis]